MLGFHRFSSSEHTGYRFGFNGMEKDYEVKGNGNHVDFGARGYDPRTGRWLSVDPKLMLQPGWSTYKFGLDNPVVFVDPDGETEYQVNITVDEKSGEAVVQVTKANKVMTDGELIRTAPKDNPSAYTIVHNYYDFATINVTTIRADGTKTVTQSTEILYEHGIKDQDIVWIPKDKGYTRRETWIPEPDMGREVAFGIGMSGESDGPIAQDWSSNTTGSIDFGVLQSILKKPSAAKGYNPGSKSWNKMENADAKAWLKWVKGNLDTGQKIGDIGLKLGELFGFDSNEPSSGISVFTCQSCTGGQVWQDSAGIITKSDKEPTETRITHKH